MSYRTVSAARAILLAGDNAGPKCQRFFSSIHHVQSAKAQMKAAQLRTPT